MDSGEFDAGVAFYGENFSRIGFLVAIESLLKLARLIKKESSAKPMLQDHNFADFI